MEFTISNDIFNKAISEVSRAVSAKTLLPILSGIKITANDRSLTIIGSNSDFVIEKVITQMSGDKQVLEVYQTGSAVVSAKFLCEIVKKLPDKIHIKANESHLLTVRSGDIHTSLNGLNADQYPGLPEVSQANKTEVNSDDLINLIKKTAFAVSKNETKPVLTGINMNFQHNKLVFAATNSHRLSLSELLIDNKLIGSYIVPSSSVNELLKLLDLQKGKVDIFPASSYILFKSKGFSLYSRLIEGNFPNVEALIPTESKTLITLDTRKLLNGIDRACLFANEWRNNNVKFEVFNGNKIRISSKSSEIGKIEETQTIHSIEGHNELSITLDGRFMIEALKAIKEDAIRLSFGGSMRPVLIEPMGGSSHLQLISPVRS